MPSNRPAAINAVDIGPELGEAVAPSSRVRWARRCTNTVMSMTMSRNALEICEDQPAALADIGVLDNGCEAGNSGSGSIGG